MPDTLTTLIERIDPEGKLDKVQAYVAWMEREHRVLGDDWPALCAEDVSDAALTQLLAVIERLGKKRDAEWAKLRGLLTAMGRQGPALEMMARIEADRKQDR
jgi:hypothetical protein